MSDAPFVVVGAGITGMAAALRLARAGAPVLLIDRVEPGDPVQTSYGNAGLLARAAVVPISEPGLWWRGLSMLRDPKAPLFIRPGYLWRMLPWLIPFLANGRKTRMRDAARTLAILTDDSVDQHETLARGTEAEAFIRRGDYAFYYRSRRDYEASAFSYALRAEAGFVPHHVEGAELWARDPALSDVYRFASIFPDHGWLSSPGGYMAALARHYRDVGGRFELGEVAALDDGRVTLAGGREIAARRIILTGGAWSARLSAPLGHKARLESERGYHLFLHGASVNPAHPFMVSDAKFVVTPMDGGLRCAGIVEFGGLDAPPGQAPTDLLKRRIAEVYPGLTYDRAETWMGHRPSTPDSLPHLGPLPRTPGVIAAFGGQHVGLTIGPKLGGWAADIALGRGPNTDLSALDPGRFA